MIRINLLPHREAKRKQKQIGLLRAAGARRPVGVVVVLAVGGYNASRIAIQERAQPRASTENAELDKKIKEIATPEGRNRRPEGAPAGGRGSAGRPQPAGVPARRAGEARRRTGVYLKTFKQDGQRVVVTGYAQSQERVAELLRNLAGARRGWSVPN